MRNAQIQRKNRLILPKMTMGGEWLHEMTKQTLNMRFIATGGILKGVLKPDEQVTQQEMLTPTGEDEAPTEQKRIDLDFSHHGRYVFSPAHTNF